MAATAEILKPEAPQIIEHPSEFPETIQQSTGAQVVQQNFKAQVHDASGTPLIQTPPTQVVTTVAPPSDTTTLTQQAKGPVASSPTWLAAFWLRVIKRALHFGWKIVGAESDV